jgi:hypothetical protein
LENGFEMPSGLIRLIFAIAPSRCVFAGSIA